MSDDVRAKRRAMSTFADAHHVLPAIAALRAAGRVFKCPVLHVVNAVWRVDLIHKTANSSAPWYAPQLLRATLAQTLKNGLIVSTCMKSVLVLVQKYL